MIVDYVEVNLPYLENVSLNQFCVWKTNRKWWNDKSNKSKDLSVSLVTNQPKMFCLSQISVKLVKLSGERILKALLLTFLQERLILILSQ